MESANLGRVRNTSDLHRVMGIEPSRAAPAEASRQSIPTGRVAFAAIQAVPRPSLDSLAYVEKLGMVVLLALVIPWALTRAFHHGPRAAGAELGRGAIP